MIAVTVVAIVGGDGDDFVVDFVAVHKLHHAEDAGSGVNAGGERLVGDEKDIQFVAIFI